MQTVSFTKAICMAKSGHTFAKRKREQEKKAKAAAKRARRHVKKQEPDLLPSTEPIEEEPIDPADEAL